MRDATRRETRLPVRNTRPSCVMPPPRYDARPPLAKLLNEVALLLRTEGTDFGLLVAAVFHSGRGPRCTPAGAQLLSDLHP